MITCVRCGYHGHQQEGRCPACGFHFLNDLNEKHFEASRKMDLALIVGEKQTELLQEQTELLQEIARLLEKRL